MEVTVRRAVAADAEASCDVVRCSIRDLCVADHGGDATSVDAWLANKTVASFERIIDEPSNACVVALHEGRVAGFAHLNRFGEVGLLYVAPDARFRGASARMLAWLEAEAARAGHASVVLQSSVTARRFYETRGYRPIGEAVPGSGRTFGWPMAKRIGADRALGGRVVVVTGIMAAGKSTVAQGVAERLPRCVHLRGDAFRRMIVSGRVDMAPNAAPEAFAQLRLRHRIAAAAAALYLDDGFTVLHQDVILGSDLERVVSLHASAPLYVVVLCPSPDVVAAREQARGKKGYGRFDVAALDRVLRDETSRIGLWIDTSDLTADETVERVVVGLELARVRR